MMFASFLPRCFSMQSWGGLAIALSVFCVGVGCSSDAPAPQLHFVLPDGYAGMFVIAVDRREGTLPIRKDDLLIFTIPGSGELLIKDNKVFEVWHSQSASYADGQAIPNGILTPSDQALHDLGMSNLRQMWYFIGTEEQKKKLFDEPGKWAPGFGVANSASDERLDVEHSNQ